MIVAREEPADAICGEPTVSVNGWASSRSGVERDGEHTMMKKKMVIMRHTHSPPSNTTIYTTGSHPTPPLYIPYFQPNFKISSQSHHIPTNLFLPLHKASRNSMPEKLFFIR
jgi:hypothetical protein